MRHPTFTILFLFVLDFTARAQLPQYQAQVFGEEYGIGGGQIFDAFTDLDGFLWITTPTTLQRFDGRNTRKFLFQENITHAMCTSDGRIWVQAGQALWHNRDDWRDFERIPFDTTGGLRLRGIFEMKNKGFFVLTTNGLYRKDAGSQQFTLWNKNIPAPTYRHLIIRLDTCENILFYHTKGAICAFNMVSGETRTLPYPIEFIHLMAVTPDLAVLTDHGGRSYWFDFGRKEVRYIDAEQYHFGRGQHNLFINGWTALGGNRFLVATKFGACEYDLTRDVFIPQRIFAGGVPIENENALQRIFQDQSGVFWAVTQTSVIAIKPLHHAFGLLRNYHFSPPNQWDTRIVGMAEDHTGNVWFGGSLGFKRMDIHTGEVRAYLPVEGAKDRLSHFSIRGMAFDGQQVIVGPTHTGAWLFDPSTERYSRPAFASDTVQKALTEDFIDYIGGLRNGDQIICGRYHPYLMRRNHSGNRSTYLVDFIQFPGDKANMNMMLEDLQGRIWLGTEKGVYCLDAQYQLLFETAVETVFDIFENAPDEYLIATKKGLRRLKLKTATASTYETTLDTISTPVEGVGIVEVFRDKLQRYWLGTFDGLYLADPQLTTFKKFDFTDNIQSQVFNPASTLLASNGMVFMGGQNGLNYFVPENIALEDNSLTASIQSLRLNDGDSVLYQPAGLLRIPYQMNTLTVEVVAPYYNNANKVRYRYRLAGHTKDWVETDGNTFRLPNLPAGEYQLEIEASVTGKLWHPAKNILTIEILPPFWQTWWFRLGAAAALLGLFYCFVRYRENRLRRRQERELEFEKLRGTALQYQLETEQVVNYFNCCISDKNTVEEALWNVAQQCIARLGWEDCVIYLFDPVRQILVQKAAWGQKSTSDQKIVRPIEIALNQGIVGAVAATGKAELIPDTGADLRYIVDDAARGSELAVPILAEGQVIGVIDSEHSQKNFYTSWHLQILTAIAALCSNKIALAETEEARQKALLEVVNNQRKAAEAKLQSMRLQMNPHFLFNALNSIQEMIMRGNSDAAAQYLSKFSKLLRMVLVQSDRDFIPLREEVEMLRLYIALEALRFEGNFAYSIDCADHLDLEEYRVPPLLIQPFVENALWHGLLQKEGSRELRIRFEATGEDSLRCTIEDNGIGRSAAGAYARNSRHTSKGIGVSTERVEALNRQYGQNNTLEIIDLLDEENKTAGTRVNIVIA